MPYKRGKTSTHRGAFWGQNREGRTGLRVSVPWGELCSPKEGNTSMEGGHGLLQRYQSHGPDSASQRGRWAPERGVHEGIPHRELGRTNRTL